jgi:hypothetical protein
MQSKFLGYVPLGARSQELQRDIPVPCELSCEDVQIRGERGIKLHALLLQKNASEKPPGAVIVYFQGTLNLKCPASTPS